MESIKKYLGGEISPKALRINLLLTLLIYGGLIVVAIAVFPGEYDLTRYTISSLGNPDLNVFPGWFFFSIASWVLAIMLLPYFRFVHAKLRKYTSRFARDFLFFAIVTDLGLVLLGFFPEFPPTASLHAVATVMSFGGFFLAAIFSWIGLYFLGKGSQGGRKRFVLGSLAVMVVAFCGSIVMAISSFLLQHAGILEGSLLANVFVWEWTLFFAVGLYVLLLEIIVSREP